MKKDAKKIAEKVVRGFEELERQGELARDGEKLAKAFKAQRKETRGWRNERLPWVGRM